MEKERERKKREEGENEYERIKGDLYAFLKYSYRKGRQDHGVGDL